MLGRPLAEVRCGGSGLGSLGNALGLGARNVPSGIISPLACCFASLTLACAEQAPKGMGATAWGHNWPWVVLEVSLSPGGP